MTNDGNDSKEYYAHDYEEDSDECDCPNCRMGLLACFQRKEGRNQSNSICVDNVDGGLLIVLTVLMGSSL
jgi:hypothetical protein